MRSFLLVVSLAFLSPQLVAEVTRDELLRYEKFGIENPLTGKTVPFQNRTKHFAEILLLKESPEALRLEQYQGALFLVRTEVAGKAQVSQLYVTPTQMWRIVCANRECQTQPVNPPKHDSSLLAAYNALQLLGKETRDFKGVTSLMITEDTQHNESNARRIFGEEGELVYESNLVFWNAR